MSVARALDPWRWIAALAVMFAASTFALRRYLPPLPSPLTLDLVVDRADAGTAEPLITSGRREAGDFLYVRYLENGYVAFGYETWGSPGQLSSPVKLPADGRLRLQIEMPALTQIRGVFAPPSNRLRLSANGVEIFNGAVRFHMRFPADIRFAENSIGGTACAAVLHGRLFLADGRELRGYPEALLTLRDRIGGWLTVSHWPALGVLLLGVATFVFWARPGWWNVPRLSATALRDRVWRHRHFVGMAAVCTISFAWMISYGTFKLVHPETFGSFFDYQMAGILQGRLDVPDEAIGGEAFVVGGKNYGYFGITPALLRAPFIIYNLYFGELSRAFMVGYFAATLLASYLLLRAVRALCGRGDGPPSRWATLCFIGGIGLGSTLYFLGSRAYVYHEAILCGVMFAVFGCWCALRHFAAPDRRWWVGSLACGVLSVHARPPTGLFALTLLATVAVAIAVQRRRPGASPVVRQLAIAALCGFGIFSFNVLSYLKFKTFEGCPLRYNVQYDAVRLARIEGKQFHLANLTTMFDRYFVRPNFRLERGFPYFTIIPGLADDEWVKTKIDYHEPTLGLPYAMPGLFALATLGCLGAVIAHPALRLLISAIGIAALPMSLAMFMAIAITHRYTADFCPLLITTAAFGAAFLERGPGDWRARARSVVSLAVVCSIMITSAITLHHQATKVWGVPDEVRARYLEFCRRVDAVVASLHR